MKLKVIFLIPVVIAAIVLSKTDSALMVLNPMSDVNLSTLFMSFPIILALTERFNEIFIVSKEESKHNTLQKTSLVSFCVGIFLAIAGFRILQTFMTVPEGGFSGQHTVFVFIDTVLTAAIISGGTDGWHQLVGLLQDITKSKRNEVKNNNQTS